MVRSELNQTAVSWSKAGRLQSLSRSYRGFRRERPRHAILQPSLVRFRLGFVAVDGFGLGHRDADVVEPVQQAMLAIGVHFELLRLVASLVVKCMNRLNGSH